jgi:predicted porin
MKKTLAAVAVLGAFAGSALAADVQLYGIVDTGFQYLNADSDIATKDSVNKFSMESGMQSGSRFGLKGTEDLGNGVTVGFILESQFSSDTGALADEDHFFRRESSLFLEGGFGKVAFGRMGSINGGVSSWAKYGVMSAFGTSWGNFSAQAGNWAVGGGLWDNMIAYETPSFAGFKVFAQYGMGNTVSDTWTDGDEVDHEVSWGTENESSSDRYYAIGASYANGPLNLYFAVDSINYSSVSLIDDSVGPDTHFTDTDDSLTVTFGGNYDFEVVKLFAGAQYFDEIKLSKLNGAINYGDANQGFAGKVKGWSLGVSGSIPVAGGNVLVGAAYVDAEAADSIDNGDEMTRWIVSAGYDYPLSKRTNVYGVLTYNQDSIEYGTRAEALEDNDPYVFGVMVGLRHKF